MYKCMNVFVGCLVKVSIGDNILVHKGEVLIMPVFHNDLWVIKDLSDGVIYQPSCTRAKVEALI